MPDLALRRRTLDPPGRGAGRRASALLVGLLLLGILAFGGVVGYYNWCRGAFGPRTPVAFRVPDGASGSEVVDMLHEQGVVRCGLVSKYLLTRSGLSDSIRAGTFDLTTNMTPAEAFAALTRKPEPVPTVELTVPEGYRLTQIAERVAEELGIRRDTFLSEAETGDYSLPPYLPKGAMSLEGFLFPKTYEFVKSETTADTVIQRLLEQFRKEVAGLPWDNAKALGLTRYEVVIVASMIERETAATRERPLIAAVIYNRLRDGMVLGIDATLQYVDPNAEDGLTESDLAIDSPYNTRLSAGLPPTPIASPGLDSLMAALEPADVDYVYFVACPRDGDGRHRFSRTFEEHDQARAECGE
ncbi:MAG: endolytic transglycosylase MltG [Actinomycetota bacterium]